MHEQRMSGFQKAAAAVAEKAKADEAREREKAYRRLDLLAKLEHLQSKLKDSHSRNTVFDLNLSAVVSGEDGADKASGKGNQREEAGSGVLKEVFLGTAFTQYLEKEGRIDLQSLVGPVAYVEDEYRRLPPPYSLPVKEYQTKGIGEGVERVGIDTMVEIPKAVKIATQRAATAKSRLKLKRQEMLQHQRQFAESRQSEDLSSFTDRASGPQRPPTAPPARAFRKGAAARAQTARSHKSVSPDVVDQQRAFSAATPLLRPNSGAQTARRAQSGRPFTAVARRSETGQKNRPRPQTGGASSNRSGNEGKRTVRREIETPEPDTHVARPYDQPKHKETGKSRQTTKEMKVEIQD
eukprot:CAMPEP_0175145006 /NCGR_PEP_ID=MMETSP0087-20121206/14498_1 /TAXON_ID=136419 /ORGANISM="Unknown Unknown, Strain D1" /LENGTH=351 /DNA_ID=CAMNT_0016429639 /DNA_START=117 /DNA_END=1172 /DNA_ORIENTATION=-